MTHLAQYLKSKRITFKQFAAVIGVDPSVVSKIANGRILPGLKTAVAIEEATRGKIKAKSWVADEKSSAA